MRIGLLALSLAALALRFVQLQADFPGGLNWSGDLYTDEGWYSNNAIAHALTGRWLIEGDFNPILTLPVFPLTEAVAFRLFGFGLVTARATAVAYSILVGLLGYGLVTRLAGREVGLASLFLLSTSFTVFAFSRLAILDLPMTALTLASLGIAASGRGSLAGRTALAALAFCLAALTKTTALFGLPSLLYLIGSSATPRRHRGWAAAGGLGLIGVLLGGYYALVQAAAPDSVALFAATEFTPRLEATVPSAVWSLGRAIWNGRVLDPIAYPLALVGLPLAGIGLRHARADRLLITCALWIGVTLLALAVRGYLPPRYYLPLAVPVSAALGWMAVHAARALRPRAAAALPLAGLAALGFLNLVSIARHLSAPQFSFIRMAEDVERQVAAGGGEPQLIGNLVNSVSLATGLPSVNSELGTRDLRWKLERYRPGYYLALGEEKATARLLEEHYALEPLASYDVFANYYAGKQVHLYRLHPRP